MKAPREFPFEKARRISAEEVAAARKAIEKATGLPRRARGRPVKPRDEKYRAISIRLHPRALAWAKGEARRRGVGYQTVINEILLERAVRIIHLGGFSERLRGLKGV